MPDQDLRDRPAIPPRQLARKGDQPAILGADRRRHAGLGRNDLDIVPGEGGHLPDAVIDPEVAGEEGALRGSLAKAIVGRVHGGAADFHPPLRHLAKEVATARLAQRRSGGDGELLEIGGVAIVPRKEERAIRAVDPDGVGLVGGERFLANLLLHPGAVLFDEGAHHVIPHGGIIDQDVEVIATLAEEFIEDGVALAGAVLGDLLELALLGDLEDGEAANEKDQHAEQEREDLRLDLHDSGSAWKLAGLLARLPAPVYSRTRRSRMETMRGLEVAALRTS